MAAEDTVETGRHYRYSSSVAAHAPLGARGHLRLCDPHNTKRGGDMARSRRSFLRETVVTGAGLSLFGMSDVEAGQTRLDAMPTPRAKALMELFRLRFPIF